ncbi:ABC transporter ATP-binding protein [Gilliamella apicola]|uniref:ABC transporter ATP-binding protein n=1 Tax=Gilliamella apicola TaxID=1196095 RepID=UPI00080DAA32|nr:ABC transporter ATP-binding protein [Gilliamella apicola]OCG12331.1 ABC transporter [Gilliamella apicola]ORF46019.1 ABC transporter [Gilliamella apicola]ORF49427.1 ABC transporter [Gilliamella apicola]ORF53480.1 ABC transporter [Gilliamella apicola]ORF55755.1 ABC transporter [Gilliamella apicola]
MFKRLLMLSDAGSKNLRQAIIACTISNLTLMLPFIILLQVIVSLITPLTNHLAVNKSYLWLMVGLGILSSLLFLLCYQREYKKTYASAFGQAANTRIEVAEKIRKLPLSFFNRKDLSELTTNIMGDCATIENMLSHVVPQLIGYSCSSVITCVLLAFYDWRMACAIFCTLPIAFLIVIIGKGFEKKLGEKQVQSKLAVSNEVQEYLDGIKIIKGFGISGEKFKTLDRALKNMMWAAIKFEGISGIFVTLSTMVLKVGLGVVVLVGVKLIVIGSLDPITFLAFIVIGSRIYSPLISVLTLLPELFYMLTSIERMRSLQTESTMEGRNDVLFKDFSINIDHINFSYKQKAVINDLSCVIPSNKMTALVGPSGSGKSTLLQLIARFWDVDKGMITIDGNDIKTIDPETLMLSMSFVFQNVILFDDTILNNIRIGRHDASDEEVKIAAKKARCDELIARLPHGWDTLIGENGSKLSGGERQRISIARALLKNAPIVLLDEATASLDPENEVYIQQAISELVKDRTVIVIAHRLKTIITADQIIVLDKGSIVEQGSYQQLIDNNGLFTRLYSLQKQQFSISN